MSADLARSTGLTGVVRSILLADLAAWAPAESQHDLRRLHVHLTQALPALLTFAVALDDVQQEMRRLLGANGSPRRRFSLRTFE